jgi:hypothetical protein
MPIVRRPTPAPAGLNAAQRVELRELLVDVPDFDPLPPHDVGEDAPPALIKAVRFAMVCGVHTSGAFRAYECYGGTLAMDSHIMDDLRRLAAP